MFTIAVVDDYPAIANSFKNTIGHVARKRGIGELVRTEVFHDAQSIMARLLDTTKPHIDVLVTDMCLDGDITQDKEGIRVAQFARNAISDIKLVAYSGRMNVEELSPSETSLFDLKFQKGGGPETLRENGEKVIELAQQGIPSDSGGSTSRDGDNTFYFPRDDEEYMNSGYVKVALSCKTVDAIPPMEFMAWRKVSEEGVELEVEGIPLLFSFGDDEQDAKEALDLLIEEFASFSDVEVASSSTEIRATCVFAREVTGRMMNARLAA